MTKPRTFYITKFESSIVKQLWFAERGMAKRFVKRVYETRYIKGEVIKVVEVEEK